MAFYTGVQFVPPNGRGSPLRLAVYRQGSSTLIWNLAVHNARSGQYGTTSHPLICPDWSRPSFNVTGPFPDPAVASEMGWGVSRSQASAGNVLLGGAPFQEVKGIEEAGAAYFMQYS
jgi:hypothetical protein